MKNKITASAAILALGVGLLPCSTAGVAKTIVDDIERTKHPAGTEWMHRNKPDPKPIDLVNPFIGTGGVGHTFPAATVPFGMVQVGPDTGKSGWSHCSGYHYDDKSIIGFSHTHLSGTGCSDLGDFLFVPMSGQLKTKSEEVATSPSRETEKTGSDENKDENSERDPGGRRNVLQLDRLPFSHDNESASPGYYSVKLDSGIQVELTASEHAGMHRYTFPQSASPETTLVIDLAHGIGNFSMDAELNIVGDHTITGFHRTRGWANDRPVYFAAEFSQPFTRWGTADEEKMSAGNSHGQNRTLKGWLTFPRGAEAPLLVRIGISTTGVEGALRNLHSEMPGFDFDGVRAKAVSAWSKELSKISIPFDRESHENLETFYTALYHCYLAPTLISDVDGLYRGSDHEVRMAKGFRNYSTFSLWDTFRAEHPLLTILTPERVPEFIKSFQAHAEGMQNRYLPIWPLYADETYCMIGYHSFPVIAEAYAKGLKDWDAEALFRLMVENSRRNDYWADRGYMSSDGDMESVAKTLEFSYDDWALSQFARALGKKAEYEKFSKRAASYKNLFDAKTGFMRGRLANGEWHSPFDPGDFSDRSNDFCEGDAWQYTFLVPHDVQGLIKLFGSREAFAAKLDALFKAPYVTSKNDDHDISGLIGQCAHGNEPSHHIAYLYDFAGHPEKTQRMVARIRREMYKNKPDGLCGNEDCGQMSAWYVFSALGFYPVNPVQCTYLIGVPMFDHCAITVPGGKKFTVDAVGVSAGNRYIKSVRLNGKELDKVYITHEQLCAGGNLSFEMEYSSTSNWGKSPESAPPGMSGQTP